MDKDEILKKSRAENFSGALDERARENLLREDSAAYGFGLLLALVLFITKILRGQTASDILALVTGMSASGFLYRLVKWKSRRKFDIFWAVLSTLLTVFYLYRFFMGAA